MIVRVGSVNPVKVRAVRRAFRMFFPRVRVLPVSVGTSVSEIPETLRGILRGARERARRSLGEADFAVGIEAGTFRLAGGTYLVTLACVTDGERWATGGSPFFAVPDLDLLRGAGASGAIGTLTGERVTREELTRAAVLMAIASLPAPSSGRRRGSG